MSRRHKLITHEGPDGLGKSTMAQKIALRAEDAGYKIKVMREPGSSEMGEALRPIIKSNIPRQNITDVLLFNAARAESSIITDDELTRNHLITDRSWLSTMAYQGYGQNLTETELTTIYSICQFAAGPHFDPDLWVIFDAPYEISAQRQSHLEKDRFEGEQVFYDRVREGYLYEANRLKEFGKHVLLIDASESESEVETKIWNVVKEVL